MAEEIAVENGRISNFEGLLTFTLALYQVIMNTVVHHSATSTYTPNFTKIKETFCGQTCGRTDGRSFETHFIRSTQKSQPKKWSSKMHTCYLLC